jgi:hypothetical protein
MHPRDEGELEIVMELVSASRDYAAGTMMLAHKASAQ